MSTALATTDGLQDHAPARIGATDRLYLLDQAAAFGFGFSLQFNVITSTFGLPFMRLSDVVPFALIPYFCLRTDFLARAWDHSARIAIVLVLLMASVVLKAQQGPGDVYMTLILIVYFVQSLQILMVFGERLLLALCAGILVGCSGSLAVLVAAGSGLDLQAYGLAVPTDTLSADLTLFMQDKLGGLWAAGNQTGHIFAAAGAAALCLSMHLKSKSIYLLYLAGVLVSFPFTSNRAGLIVPLIAMVFVVWRGLRAWQFFLAAAILGLIGLYAGLTGDVPLPASLADAVERRLYADSNVDANLYERLESTLGAVELIARNPFGIGNIAMENELQVMTGVSTPHNGVISLGQQCGILIALLYVVSVVQIFIGRSRDYGWFVYLTAVFSFLSMLSEQLTATQYFLFLIALMLAAWVARSARPQPRPHGAGEVPDGIRENANAPFEACEGLDQEGEGRPARTPSVELA